MKNIQIITVLCFSTFSLGQVSIGKEDVDGTSTLLDFVEEGNIKGVILPAVANVDKAIATAKEDNNGTFLFDKKDKMVKMYENGEWKALSVIGSSDKVMVNTSKEEGKGVIIGAETTQAEGVLVLESDNKAMVLPKIANPHTSVKSPYPGMICYDTVKKSVAVFDGVVWNYWK